jgi:hypothetical protein
VKRKGVKTNEEESEDKHPHHFFLEMEGMDRTDTIVLGILAAGVALIYAAGGTIDPLSVGWSIFGGAAFILVWRTASDIIPRRRRKRRK